MSKKPYGMICPITRVCEILEPRWTIAIIVALWAGNTKFNDIRREIGSISPGLLTKRLRELEGLGLVERIEDRATGKIDYLRTEKAIALEPALELLAKWSQQHVDGITALCTASASSLMRKMRKILDSDALPDRRVVIQFHFAEDLEYDTYWVLANPGAPIEICTSIPGYDIDLFVETTAMSLVAYLLGRTTIAREKDLGELFLSGDAVLSRTIEQWLPQGEYAQFANVKELSEDTSQRRSARAALANV
ncbi:MAG: helix-turn-helix transcriptional regulator [Silicimonas sp.]|nr:helix-turn-helix transcriptional regulator [Silicimonas sp.]